MPNLDLSLCRSVLFLPASNPRAIQKARELPADMIILDLEDAVREEDKESARDAAVEAMREGFGGRPSAIRINAVGHPQHGADMVAVRGSGASYVVLPKTESLRQITDTKVVCERPVIAMVETARGVIDLRDFASASAALIAGTNDLSADLRIPPGSGRAGLNTALQRIVLAARAARIPAFDGVYNGLEGDEALAEQANEGRAFGFDGKSVIHPSQIDTVNRIFSPSQEELEAASKLILAASGGAERHEGQMIEGMHVAHAQALIQRARR